MAPLSLSFDIQSVAANFLISGKISETRVIGEGHINDTFYLNTDSAEEFIIQRINHHIFKDVAGLMENISRVTSHINQTSINNPPGNSLKAPMVVLTREERNFFKDQSGNYWRCYSYIPHQPVNRMSIEIASEGGRAIGRFQNALSCLPGGALHETIPDFHNLRKRLDAFNMAVRTNKAGRLQLSANQVKAIAEREEELLKIHELESVGLIPVRVTHNDTKFNNILFDKNQSAIGIVDLDTVMNGSVLYDFGDAIRTLCNTATEDESDLSKVNFDVELFDAFARGYLSETSGMLQAVEIDLLAFSCKLLTYIMAVRFLTDFLNGDIYFKVKSPMHNFHRAANQIRLLECMEMSFETMESVTRKRFCC